MKFPLPTNPTDRDLHLRVIRRQRRQVAYMRGSWRNWKSGEQKGERLDERKDGQ